MLECQIYAEFPTAAGYDRQRKSAFVRERPAVIVFALFCGDWMSESPEVAKFSDSIPRTSQVVMDGMRAGLHIGAQLVVARDGDQVCDVAIGSARPDSSTEGESAMRPDTLMLWLSSGKPVTAIAVMQLMECGVLQLDDPVGLHIPEFAANGKQDVTIKHLLTHVGGFRFVDLGDASTPWNEIIRRLCVAPLERGWVPGERAGYHPYTSWYVLGEIVARLSDKPFPEYVREHIFLPLGMVDCWIGMPESVRDSYGSRLGVMANTESRGDVPPTLKPHPWSTPEGLIACAPGGNAHGPMRQLVKLYEMLSAGGMLDGVRVLTPESVALLTARSRVGMFDETFRHQLDWGLGIIPNNRRYGIDAVPYGYGRHASDSAFGHSGSQSSVAFADPEHGLCVAVVLNGTCGEVRHQKRIKSLLNALYEDLGIVRND